MWNLKQDDPKTDVERRAKNMQDSQVFMEGKTKFYYIQKCILKAIQNRCVSAPHVQSHIYRAQEGHCRANKQDRFLNERF